MPALAAMAAMAALAALLGAALAGCGGGVDSGGTGVAPANVVVGPVSGFGSIVVAGIHHDESGATIVDDDGEPLDAQALKLGTMTVIEGSTVVRNGDRRESRAQRVRVGEQVLGPVSALDAATGTLRVLGQRITVTPTTVFDERLAAGLAALQPGDLLAVHGQLDPAGERIVATRIEPRGPTVAALVLRAAVTRYDGAQRRATIGGLEVDLAAVPELPAALAAGTVVRVKLRPQVPSSPAQPWVASALRVATLVLPDVDNVEIEGRITQFDSPQRFSVDGVLVDASAARFSGGTGGLVLGARVEVEGPVRAGTLVAREVELESDDDPGIGRIEIEGRISALDAAAQTFVVRGVTVSYAGAPVFEGGSAADLALDRQVAVKGSLSPDRTRVLATLIKIER